MIKNVLQWLEDSARKYPDKKAFTDPEKSISFEELLWKSRVAGTFLSDYIKQRDAVSFYLNEGVNALCGMFGAVYAGGFYSLMDFRHPKERLNGVLDVLESKVIITDRTNKMKAEELFGERNILIFVIEDILESGVINNDRLNLIRTHAQDTDPLYVNFTSGSTGTPKGVAVCHRSVIDFIPVLDDRFGIKENDVLGNQAPFDFDVSVKDIFTGLYTGAEVVIIPTAYFSYPVKLMDFLCNHHVTVLIWAVSAMCFVSIMGGFDYRLPGRIRLVMFSGEVMPVKQYNIWKKKLPWATFVNLYGPTEITCNCTYYVLEDRVYAKHEKFPIGRAFDNEKVFLLDDENHEVTEPGIPGEVCVAGTCLALGYFKDPERTSAVFTQNPLNHVYPERIYRTGDLAEYLPDGNLVYVSRKDFQIKHLGHRIELGEIEAKVLETEGISRVCCIYDEKKKRILCFYTGTENPDLSNELKKTLPTFMLPNKIYHVDEMPMTKNGKIDRNVLKEIGGVR